jgi:hypothetical protein
MERLESERCLTAPDGLEGFKVPQPLSRFNGGLHMTKRSPPPTFADGPRVLRRQARLHNGLQRVRAFGHTSVEPIVHPATLGVGGHIPSVGTNGHCLEAVVRWTRNFHRTVVLIVCCNGFCRIHLCIFVFVFCCVRQCVAPPEKQASCRSVRPVHVNAHHSHAAMRVLVQAAEDRQSSSSCGTQA